MSAQFFFSFTRWMTCEMPLIHALPTLWIAPQNLPFRLSNSGYRMSAYLVGTNSIIKYASFICVEGWLLVTSIRTDSIVILFNSKRFCRNIDSYHFSESQRPFDKIIWYWRNYIASYNISFFNWFAQIVIPSHHFS